MQNTVFSTNKTLNIGGRLLSLETPKIMGILNVTPDSFYDGGRYTSEKTILLQAEKMIREGVDIIDVGGYSTRPGADEVTGAEETLRVTQAIRQIVKEFPDAVISIDTFRSDVARAAVNEGAVMINDISGGSLDEKMFHAVAELGVPYILMHMRGTPKNMTTLTEYDNIIKEMIDFFHQKIAQLRKLSVKDIIVDPGFGFAKTREQNFYLLNNLEQFHIIGLPLLVGLSRKSMVWKTLEVEPADALNGTTALHAIALQKGAGILRVHDVKEAREVVRVITAMSSAKSEEA